jgi:hypothetical protein
MRKCTVDGIYCASVRECETTAGIGHGMLAFNEKKYGLSFTINGHVVVLEPRDGEATAPRGPTNFLDRALKDRKRYDEQGVARAGLLRRPA